jgi:MFS family permease
VEKADRGRAFGLEGVGDNAGAFLGPVIAVLLLMVYHLPIRMIFYVAIIPGLLAFVTVLLVRERPIQAAAKSKLDMSLKRFPAGYWRCLLATALFGIGNRPVSPAVGFGTMRDMLLCLLLVRCSR